MDVDAGIKKLHELSIGNGRAFCNREVIFSELLSILEAMKPAEKPDDEPKTITISRKAGEDILAYWGHFKREFHEIDISSFLNELRKALGR